MSRELSEDLRHVLADSTFFVADGTYCCAKAAKAPSTGRHFMVAMDDSETTIITEITNLPLLDAFEINATRYTPIGINVAAPFTCVGFLAAVTDAVAERGIDLLAVSTYSRDYILVEEHQAEGAAEALVALGISRVEGGLGF
jgi:hypothetical protein